MDTGNRLILYDLLEISLETVKYLTQHIKYDHFQCSIHYSYPVYHQYTNEKAKQ